MNIELIKGFAVIFAELIGVIGLGYIITKLIIRRAYGSRICKR